MLAFKCYNNNKACTPTFAGMTRNKLIIIFLIATLLSTITTNAEPIIRDSEIESVVREAVNPIIKAANIGDINIYLLQNNEVNAFTAGGNDIFVNSGLIATFPDADVLKGVIAHEIGHIMGHHISRQIENVANQSKIAIASVAVGLISGIASTDPSMIIAGSLAGMDMAEKSLMKYSRTYESSADQAAFKLLEKSGNSIVGMKKLFQFFMTQNRPDTMDKYLLTHPLSNERLETVNRFLPSSQYRVSTTNPAIQKRFERAAYKLFAFTAPKPDITLRKISFITNQELGLYVKAISYLRMSDYKNSIDAINQLLDTHPADPYYNELKGQILFEFGKKDAIKYFEKAVDLVPNDALMKMNTAIVAWSVYRADPETLAKFIPYIKFMQQKEPESLTSYYYLSLYYGSMHNDTLSKLYLAIFYDKQNNPQAKTLAKKALEGLKAETPEWYWAKDIIERE